MKRKAIYICLVCGLVVLCLGAGLENVSPHRSQYPLKAVRTVTTSDTALTGSTKTWSSIESLFATLNPAYDHSSINFLCYGDGVGPGDPSSGTFSFKVFTCRQYGSAQLVCSGDVTVGTLEASHNPQTGQTVTDSQWAEGQFTVTDVWKVSVGASGTTNEMGSLNWYTLNELGFYVEITALTNLSSVTVFYTGYSL